MFFRFQRADDGKIFYFKEVYHPIYQTRQKWFFTLNMFPKSFFHWMGMRAHPGTRKRKALGPHSNEKKLFGNILSVKIHFLKSQGIYLESGLGFMFKWLNFSKNAWNFALFEIGSGCRCDMKIIFGAFDNLDAKLLSNKIFCHHLLFES